MHRIIVYETNADAYDVCDTCGDHNWNRTIIGNNASKSYHVYEPSADTHDPTV